MKRISHTNHSLMRSLIAAVLALVLFASPMFVGSASASNQYYVGEVVTFGRYEQDNNPRDGAEDIQWIVIDKDGDYIMLISKYCLDAIPYHDTLESINWEFSSLRHWLNEDFLETAFTPAQRKNIAYVENQNPEHYVAKTSSGRATIDRVFILNLEEAENLFDSYASRMSGPTAYAIAQGAYINNDNLMGWWWLRTTSFKNDHVTYVASGGGVSHEGRDVNRTDAGVRPVIWVKVA